MSNGKIDHERPLSALGGAVPAAPEWFQWALAQPSDEGEVAVAGARIRYSAWGDVGKRGLVFIHGGRAHRNWWRPFAPYFAGAHRVVAFDMSGMGDSDWRARYCLAEAIEEVFAVIHAARADEGGRPLVVGHSFGAWVTLAAVEKSGERLAGAVVVDGPIGVPDPDEGYTVIRKRKPDEEGLAEPRPNKVYATIEEPVSRFRFLPNQGSTELYLVDYIARTGLTKAPGEGGAAGWTWKFDPSHGRNFEIHFDRDLFLAARCPLAFIYGENSAFATGDGFEHLRTQARGRSPFIVMPTVHHHLMMEEPLAFISALRTLLTCWPVRVGV